MSEIRTVWSFRHTHPIPRVRQEAAIAGDGRKLGDNVLITVADGREHFSLMSSPLNWHLRYIGQHNNLWFNDSHVRRL